MSFNKRVEYYAYWCAAHSLFLVVIALLIFGIRQLIIAFNNFLDADIVQFTLSLFMSFICFLLIRGFIQILDRLPRWYSDVEYEHDSEGWMTGYKIKK
jgi:hypothetical protein